MTFSAYPWNNGPTNPPGHIPGFHLPGSTIPIAAAAAEVERARAAQLQAQAIAAAEIRRKRRRNHLLMLRR